MLFVGWEVHIGKAMLKVLSMVAEGTVFPNTVRRAGKCVNFSLYGIALKTTSLLNFD